MTPEPLALAAALSAAGCTVAVAWSVHRSLIANAPTVVERALDERLRGLALAFLLLAAAVLVASVLSPS